jgi:hypothetical protein
MNSETKAGGASVAQRIDAMEEAYEFMLAYAARGVMADDPMEEGGVRHFLERMVAAQDDLVATALEEARRLPPGVADACAAFLEVLAGDIAKALPAISLVLARPAIGSQMIDNLNANIHLRAVLADLFMLDETLKG